MIKAVPGHKERKGSMSGSYGAKITTSMAAIAITTTTTVISSSDVVGIITTRKAV